MAKSRATTIKVGILTLVSLSLLVFVLIWLRGRGLTSGEPYQVRFNDVDGMREGAAVQFMGIRVGFVDKISPQIVNGKYYVNVTFSLNQPDLNIPRGSKLSVEQSGLIGEKLLEITPPPVESVTLTMFKEPSKDVMAGIPVKFLYEEGFLEVGKVEKVEKFVDENILRYKLSFRITHPGAVIPKDPFYELALDTQGNYFLRVLPQTPVIVHAPDRDLIFTVENPLRMKRFLEIQLASAEALKVTNEKVNQLLSDETIATLNSTLKNTEILTARAKDVLDSANALFQTTNRDLDQLVRASDQLVSSVTAVSRNVNDVIGHPQLKSDIVSTVASVEASTRALSEILKDPSLKETLALTRDTSRSASELIEVLKQTAQDKDLQNRLDSSLTNLDTSLAKLSSVLGKVHQIADDKDQTLEGIVDDTRDTAENLREFSKKLNQRFLLFRLLF